MQACEEKLPPARQKSQEYFVYFKIF